MTTRFRRLGVAVAATAALLISSFGGVAVAEDHTTLTDDPAEAAAGWLVSQLTDGNHLVEFGGPQTGLTADAVYALAAVGRGADAIDAMSDWLEAEAGTFSDSGSGATAKLLLTALVTGRDVEDFGGVDLVDTLIDTEEHGVFSAGFVSTTNQALSILALARTDGVAPSAGSIQVLLDQQCEDGGFREELASDPASDDDDCTGSPDDSAYAVQALLAVGDAEAVDAAEDAVDWLVTAQFPDGAFGPWWAPSGSANSTGLAAVALEMGGEAEAAAAARDWLISLQQGCATDQPGAILADPDAAGSTLFATPQAIHGLTGESLLTIDATTATSDAPVLACEEPEGERDVQVSCDVQDEVAPGADVGCTITGLEAGEQAHVLVTMNPTLLDDEVTADADGTAPFAFSVPDDAAPGSSITIVVNGEAGDAVLASLTLLVAGDGSDPGEAGEEPVEQVLDEEPLEGTEAAPGELPRTGGSVGLVALLAVSLLAAGTTTLVRTRARERST